MLTGKPSDPLDVFKHEIAAVEAGAADEAAADDPDTAVPASGDRAATPDELEFEDDDGTLYRWDHNLHKYVPAAEADASASAAVADKAGSSDASKQQRQHDYDIEAMTFVAEEEVIPTLAAARAAEEAATGKDNKVRGLHFPLAVPCVQPATTLSARIQSYTDKLGVYLQ